MAAAGATDHHLTSEGGAKLHVVPILGAWVPPEQLGYTSAAANWGAVAQIAFNAGFTVLLGRREYLTSSTAYIRSRTGVIGHGDRVSGVKAVDGFAGNVLDTEGYATLRNTGATANALGIAVGVLLQPVLKDFYIDGKRPGAAEGTATTRIGVRLYCRMPSLHNLRVVNCAAHGVETALAAGNPDPFVSLDHSLIGVVSGLSVMECGREGWLFRGPADIPCDRVFIGNNGKAGAGVYDGLSPWIPSQK